MIYGTLLQMDDPPALFNELAMRDSEAKDILTIDAALAAIAASGAKSDGGGSWPQTLEDAIRRMAPLPASRLGLRDRGVIVNGAAADLVVFDAGSVADRATFFEPHQFATGIDYVIVNGVSR